MIKITFITRQGIASTNRYANRKMAAARLFLLDAIEEETKRCAPTDSGDVRFNYNAEANAIRDALS